MSTEPHVTTEFRRYLLGDLPEPARTAFEEAYFSDPELMEEIWAAETDLVDAYVTNRLDADERRLFEVRYLTSPQRRERVAVARALQARIEAAGFATAASVAAAATTKAGQPAPPVPFRPKAAPATVAPQAQRPRMAVWQWAAAAALILAAATVAWLLYRPGGPLALPPPSSASSTPAPPATPTPTPTPPDQRQDQKGSTPAPPETVPPGTATPGTNPGPLATGPTPPPGGTRSPLVALAVTLSPIQLRSDAGQTSVTVPPNTDRITLRFEGDRGAANEVAVEVRTVEGRRVWSGGLRIERPTPSGIAAAVTVPAKALPPDDYIATVFAIDANTGEKTELNRYVFRIARKQP